MTTYEPSENDLRQLLHMLGEAGQGQNSAAVVKQLKEYEANPMFCHLLCIVFRSTTQCVPSSHPLPLSWAHYRSLAGLTLKNNIQVAHSKLGEDAIKGAATASGAVLTEENENKSLIRTAAQILARVTSSTSIEWWATSLNIDLSDILLNNLLKSTNPLRVQASLYTLQYLLEDASLQIGAASERIISSVSSLHQNPDVSVRRKAFHLICQVYAIGSQLDWNVDSLTDMQRGLGNSSHFAVHFCSFMLTSDALQDTELMRNTLECCTALLDYLDTFSHLIPFVEVFTQWIQAAVHFITTPPSPSPASPCEGDTEIIAAACDFISYMVQVSERVDNEGPIQQLILLLEPHVVTLVTCLFRHMIMQPEEEESLLANDHYQLRDKYSSKTTLKDRYGDEADGAASSDEEAKSATLRRSASVCLDKACLYWPVAVFPKVLEFAQENWKHSDWHMRDVAIFSLGATVEGSYDQLSPHLETLVPHLIQAVKTADNEHRCIPSMALWMLFRVSHWFFITEEGYAVLPQYIDAILGSLTSTSKRIQAAGLTSLQGVLLAAKALDHNPCLIEYLPAVFGKIAQCLPFYHTSNLALLATNAIQLLYVCENIEQAKQMMGPFVSEFPARLGRYKSTFEEYYAAESHQTTTKEAPSMVEKDVFDIARVISHYFNLFMVHDSIIEHLSIWTEILHGLIEHSIEDDPELVQNPLDLCSMLVTAAPTQLLKTFPHMQYLIRATQKLLIFPSSTVQGCACQLLGDVISSLQTDVIRHIDFTTILDTLQSLVDCNKDLNVTLDAVKATRKLLMLCYNPETGATICLEKDRCSVLLRAVAQELRADVFDYTLKIHIKIAHEVCAMLVNYSTVATPHIVSTIASILQKSDNVYEKGEATTALCKTLCSLGGESLAIWVPDPQGQVQLVESFMRMIYSWQQGSDGECQRAIAAALRHLEYQLPHVLHSVSEKNDPVFVKSIFSHYGIVVN